jgi:transcriptional regulator GlxA family with amidase domain
MTAQGKKHSHTVAMLLYPGVSTVDVMGPLECFGLANYISGRPFYHIVTVTQDGAAVAVAGSWLQLTPTHAFETAAQHIDTLLVAGGPAYRQASQDRLLVDWLTRQANRSQRVASICNGAFILAATGLLDQHKVTTHWLFARELGHSFPSIKVDPACLFVQSGKFWSSGGMTAGMDMVLAMIERDLGRPLALEVARHLVLFLHRAGGQAQFSMHLQAQFSDVPAIERIQNHIVNNPEKDLSIKRLADHAAMSTRTLLRQFKDAAGMTVGDFIANVRVRHACRLLEQSGRELKEIATLSGLGTEANMRKVFARHLGVSPAQYRSQFSGPSPGQRFQTSDFGPTFSKDEHWLSSFDTRSQRMN